MRNFTYLLLAAMLSGTAAYAQRPNINGVKVRESKSFAAMKAAQPKSLSTAAPFSSGLLKKSSPLVKDFPKPVLGDSIITSVEGEEHTALIRSDYSFYYFWGYLIDQVTEAAKGSFIVAPDGTIYLENPITTIATGMLKLEKQDDSLYVAKLPQAIYSQDNGDGTMLVAYANKMNLAQGESGLSYVADSVHASISFIYKDGELREKDTTTTSGYPNELLALTDSMGGFYGYGSGLITIKKFNETASVPEDDATASDFVFTTNDIDEESGAESTTSTMKQVAISKDGKTIYLHDPYSDSDSLWIKGTVSDDSKTVSFPRQFMGYNTEQGSYVWMWPATASTDKYEGYYGDSLYEYVYAPADGSLTFDYDAATKTLTAKSPKSLVVNASPNRLYYLGAYTAPKYAPFVEVAATPADPTLSTYTPYDDSNGYGYISFNIPCSDTQGNFINPNKLYYNFFVDDETPYEFASDEYTALTETMTDVPYAFADGWDFYVTDDLHTLYFYFSDAEKIGIQSIYKGAGETRKSNLVWLVTSGVNAINEEPVAGKTEYYDVMGRKVNGGYKGLLIKKVTGANGAVRTTKFVNR